MRLVQSRRLSQEGDAATGFDKQEERAAQYARERGHEIVATADDRNVSGGKDPFERPALGRWLRDPARLDQFDGLIASALDRFGRNARHLHHLREWADGNGKTLIVVEQGLEWPPPPKTGQGLVWEILGWLAEYELDAITDRNRATQAYLRREGFLVGRPMWGYRVVEVDGSAHKTLQPDPDLSPYLLGAIERALAGESYADICRWLDSEGAHPARGGLWSTVSLRQILRNPVLVGRRMSNSRGRREGPSRTELRVDPLIDAGKFARLQKALDALSTHRGKLRDAPAMLTGVAYCDRCGRVLHHRVSRKRRKDGTYGEYRYYRCDGTQQEPSTCRLMVRADALETWTGNWFLPASPIGMLPLVERVVVPGAGHEDEIAEIEQDIREIDLDAPDAGQRFAELHAERARLQALPTDPDVIQENPLGVTVAEHWRGLDTAGRRAFLLDAGLTVRLVAAKPRLHARLVPTDVDAFESTMRFGKRGVKSAEPWKREGARLILPAV